MSKSGEAQGLHAIAGVLAEVVGADVEGATLVVQLAVEAEGALIRAIGVGRLDARGVERRVGPARRGAHERGRVGAGFGVVGGEV